MEKLPNNWIKTDLDTVILRMTNGSGLRQEELPFEGSLPISRIETIWNETIDLDRVKYVSASDDDIKKYALQKGDVLFSHINSDKHLGKTAVFNIDKTVIHGINLLLLRAIPQFNGDLLNYILRHYRFSGKFIEVAQRSVNQSSINQKKLKSFTVPLPPLAEQQRIVAKLDGLFGHLDSLKQRLELIPSLLKQFRQSVLTQAVTGKLTEEWREGKELGDVNSLVKNFLADLVSKEKSLIKKNKIKALIKEKSLEEFKIPNKWKFFKLNKLCLGFTYGSSSKSLNEGLVPVLRMGNLQEGKIDWNKLKYSVDENEIQKYLLSDGDVLFNRTNSPELVGKTSLYSGEQKAIYAGYLIKIKTSHVLNSNYLNYALNSPYSKEWCWKVKTDGVSQSNINAQKLSQFNLPLPSKEEQTEIVKRVENLFSKAYTIEAAYQNLKQQIDSLPQAILAKAFKGELVEQLSTDGDAKDLLKEIATLRTSLEKGKKSKKKQIQ